MNTLRASLADGGGVFIGWRAVYQLEGCDVGGLLRAIGDDPQLQLIVPGGRLDPGLYRVTVQITPLDGEIGLPVLYVNEDQTRTIRMRSRLGGTEWTAIILVDEGGATQLRLDPADRPVTFQLGDIVMEAYDAAAGAMALADEVKRLGRDIDEPFDGDIRASIEALYHRYVHDEHDAARIDNRHTYAHFVEDFESPGPKRLQALRDEGLAFARRPLLTVIMPVYETPERWLRECIESVIAQAWVDWELCIANDASPSAHVREVLDEYAARDSRVRVCHRPRNGHISAASNTALAMARGEFVALLDHDDLLPPHALLEVARVVVAHPDVKLVYSDEDKVSEDGGFYDPYFKPAWNPELFLSQNYLSHLGVYRTSMVRDVGGFREGYEGSQDYDLALRCVATLRDDQVAHIPRILYHWRAIAGSTALDLGEKHYAVDAGERALADHLARTGQIARVEPSPGGYRVRRPLPAPPPSVELVIPTRDRLDLVRTCVESILGRSTYSDFRITVVDNGSVEDVTLDWLSRITTDDRVRVLRDDGPFNYSRLNNRAVAMSDADIIGLVNNDIEVITPDWLEEMASHAVREDVGAVGAMLYYPDQTIQHAGVMLGIHGVAGHVYKGAERGHTGQMGRPRLVQALSAVTAACLLVRRDTWNRVGGLDESLTVAFNDIDFCLRVRELGYRNVWTPFAELFHYESASRGFEDTPEKMARFNAEIDAMFARWGDALRDDPAHNPNLSLLDLAMVPAFPPRARQVRLGGSRPRRRTT